MKSLNSSLIFNKLSLGVTKVSINNNVKPLNFVFLNVLEDLIK